MANPKLVLEAALIARENFQSLADWMEVQDKLLAKDLERCGRYQLSIFDAKQKIEEMKETAKLGNYGTMAAFAGQPLEFKDTPKDDDFEDDDIL